MLIIFILAMLLIPRYLGNVFYNSSVAIESKFYGFEQRQVDIGEMQISLYQNNLPDKPTLILLHGYSADKTVWLRFGRHLSDKYNVIIPDMAGHGDTGFSNDWDYSAPAQAARIQNLMDELELEKIHIVGNSMGGFIAAQFATMFPERTLSATLIDPTGVKSPKPSDMDKLVAKGVNPFIIQNRQQFDDFYAMTMAEPPWIPFFVLDAIAEKYKVRQQQLIKIFAGYHGKDNLDKSLHKIKAPVLLLWGAKDRLIHVSTVEIWKAGVENIKVKIWPNIGHMPMLEIPQESAEVYLQFLEQFNGSGR